MGQFQLDSTGNIQRVGSGDPASTRLPEVLNIRPLGSDDSSDSSHKPTAGDGNHGNHRYRVCADISIGFLIAVGVHGVFRLLCNCLGTISSGSIHPSILLSISLHFLLCLLLSLSPPSGRRCSLIGKWAQIRQSITLPKRTTHTHTHSAWSAPPLFQLSVTSSCPSNSVFASPASYYSSSLALSPSR